MFVQTMSWDNRRETKANRLQTCCGRTWTRRVQRLEDQDGNVKLKFDDGGVYAEYLIPQAFVQTIWDRFKDGQSITDAVSILGSSVPKPLRSRKADEGKGNPL